MLNQISWQQFLIASLIISLVWYLVIFLMYDRKSLVKLIKFEKKTFEKIARDWDDELEDNINDVPDDNLMGKSSETENGVITSEMSAIRFAPRKDEALKTLSNDNSQEKEIQLGLIPDLIEELTFIFKVLKNENGQKADFIELFDLLKAKFPQLKKLENRQPLINFISDSLPFAISEEDLNPLWQ